MKTVLTSIQLVCVTKSTRPLFRAIRARLAPHFRAIWARLGQSFAQRKISCKITGGTFEWTRPHALYGPIKRSSSFKCPSRYLAWHLSFEVLRHYETALIWIDLFQNHILFCIYPACLRSHRNGFLFKICISGEKSVKCPAPWLLRQCTVVFAWKCCLFCLCAYAQCRVYYIHHVEFHFRFRALVSFPV